MKKITVEFYGYYLELQPYVAYDEDGDVIDESLDVVAEGFDADETHFETEGKKYDVSDFAYKHCPENEEEAKESDLPWIFGEGKFSIENTKKVDIEERMEEVSADYMRMITYENSGKLEIEIPNEEEFDPTKVLIYGTEWVFTDYVIKAIRAFVYDGKGYELECEDSREIDSEVVWGYEPEEEE